MADDIANYEPKSLSSVPRGNVVIFIVATYGEGNPPDSAVELDDYLRQLSQAGPASCTELQHLQYLIFGLGSTKYQHYNKFARDVDEGLQRHGAKRLGYAGFRDETLRLDRDWDDWADDATSVLAKAFQREVRESKDMVPETSFDIVDLPVIPSQQAIDLTQQSARQDSRGHTQWHLARIAESKILTKTARGPGSEAARIYLHVEFDLSDTEPVATYETGDHVAVLPQNHDREVLRLTNLFGWDERKARTPIEIVLRHGKTEGDVDFDPVPSPTTRDAILRHHLDICGAPSREVMRLVANFAPTAAAKEFILALLGDDDEWVGQVIAQHRTVGELMELATAETPHIWSESLFIHLIQVLPRLRPRYFSISSSPLVERRRLSITIGVLATPLSDERVFYGLATNYLLSLHRSRGDAGGETDAGSPHGQPWPTYNISGPLHKTAVHIRSSDFKPPRDTSRPVILVAAGSGIAPFVGFTLERQMLFRRGAKLGRTILFFGCRSKEKDFLYEKEWQSAEEEGILEVDVAESRGGGEKAYVQDRIRARIADVLGLLLKENAMLYICGSVNMAKGVKDVIIEGCKQMGKADAEIENLLAEMKASKQLQEDVWA